MGHCTRHLHLLAACLCLTACLADHAPSADGDYRIRKLLDTPAPPDRSTDCLTEERFESPLDDSRWQVFGDAEISDGHLLLTQGQRNQKSGLFLVGDPIVGDNFQISLRVSSGRCAAIGRSCPGELADGFAVSIWDVHGDDVGDLYDRLGGGGHLGAAFRPNEPTIPGLNVEFDMYYNSIPRHRFADPVDAPHIAVFHDGLIPSYDDDADADSTAWAEVPEMADNLWHSVTIRVDGERVRITVDGLGIIDTIIPDLDVRGGVLALTATTGGVEAFHRIDRISLVDYDDACEARD